MHVKESIQIVETALMEKEQAQIREQQLDHEIARLKRAMQTIVREAGERTSREVATVREECNKSIDKMATEIQKLEVVIEMYGAHYNICITGALVQVSAIRIASGMLVFVSHH